MNPTRLIECYAALGWTRRGFARLLGRDEATVRQWERGAVRIPDEVARWLETRAKHAERHPPPVRGG